MFFPSLPVHLHLFLLHLGVLAEHELLRTHGTPELSGVLTGEDIGRSLETHCGIGFSLRQVKPNGVSVLFESMVHGGLFHHKVTVYKVDDSCVTL